MNFSRPSDPQTAMPRCEIGSTSSVMNSSIQSSFFWNSGSVSKSHAMASSGQRSLSAGIIGQGDCPRNRFKRAFEDKVGKLSQPDRGPAVDGQHHTGDELGFVGGQEQGGVGG